jgi:dipeptidyl aminopeptidase/acylaminoacyl peptidase
MEYNKAIPTRKIIIAVVFFVIFIILVKLTWDYFHTGKIIITTNNSQSSIVLSNVNSDNVGGATGAAHKATGKLSVNVSLGHYVATVSNGQKVVTQLITLGSNTTLRYDITLNNTLTTVPVINTTAQDIAVSSSKLVYLNTSTNSIDSIDNNNSLSTLNTPFQFQTVKWANVNFGVGQDRQQDLYLVNNDSVSTIKLPSPTSDSTNEYSVASDEQIYVSIGSNVYVRTSDGNFKKIYTTPSAPLVIGGSNNKVAVAYSTDESGDDDDDSGVTIATISTSGQVEKTSPGEDVSSLIWSPNNNYLASLNESSINIYTASLHAVAIIPTAVPIGYLSWLSNNKVIYAGGGKLWTYDLSNGRADLIATMPLATSVTGLAVSQNGSSIYISTANTITAGNSAILEVNLNRQQPSSLAEELQVLLPMALNGYTMSLVNFAQPSTIMVVPSSLQSNANQNSYIQDAQTALQQDGFNIAQLRFSFSQPD